MSAFEKNQVPTKMLKESPTLHQRKTLEGGVQKNHDKNYRREKILSRGEQYNQVVTGQKIGGGEEKRTVNSL